VFYCEELVGQSQGMMALVLWS